MVLNKGRFCISCFFFTRLFKCRKFQLMDNEFTCQMITSMQKRQIYIIVGICILNRLLLLANKSYAMKCLYILAFPKKGCLKEACESRIIWMDKYRNINNYKIYIYIYCRVFHEIAYSLLEKDLTTGALHYITKPCQRQLWTSVCDSVADGKHFAERCVT